METQGDRRPVLAILAVWGALCVFLLAYALTSILDARFPDQDDVLRLVQVRDLLAGQGWFDLHQYRIDPPHGTLMHWSRIVDAPLAALIFLLTPVIGSELAERITLVAVPLLTLGGILFCVGRLALRLFDKETMVFVCLCVGIFSPVMFQLQPNRIDHHGYQILAVAAALWSLAGQSRVRGSAIAGLAMAFGLSISIELLPMAGAFGIVLALRWFRDADQRWSLTAYMLALALGLTGLFLGTRGLADLAQHCDVIAPAHLAFFATTALGTLAIAKVSRVSNLVLIALFVGAGLAGFAVFASISPVCVSSPFGTLHPLVHEYWYTHVAEGRPIWEQPIMHGATIMAQLLVALGAAIAITRQHQGTERAYWTEYSLLLALAILGGAATFRSVTFAEVIAAIPFGWLTLLLFRKLRQVDRFVYKLAAAVAMCLLLQPLALFTVVQAMTSREPAVARTMSVRSSSCELQESAKLLNRLEPAIVFAALDIGPSLLHNTHHALVATSHHRANMAMHDVILAFTSPEAEARAIVEAHGADYLVVCLDLAEPLHFAVGGGRASLMSRIMRGNEPDWLEPIDLGTPESFKVYRVK